jgi:predicted rRNA methylase YqxC with S4 and FtsJ domains
MHVVPSACRIVLVLTRRDVGCPQVAERVRRDARVTVMERTNLRYLALGDLPDQAHVDLATLDLSFISVLKVLPAVCGVLTPAGSLLVLIKPQFEAGRDEVRAPVHHVADWLWAKSRCHLGVLGT